MNDPMTNLLLNQLSPRAKDAMAFVFSGKADSKSAAEVRALIRQKFGDECADELQRTFQNQSPQDG